LKLNFKLGFSFIIGILLVSSSSHAQGNHVENLVQRDFNPYHFGFILSVNQMNFSLKVNESAIGKVTINPDVYEFANADSVKFQSINNEPVVGFTVGIVTNLRIAPLLDLRFIPSLSFGERKLNYSFISYKDLDDPINQPVSIQKSIRSTHIDLPLYIKYKSKRAHNIRAYVLGGVKYTYDLAANSKKNEEANADLLLLNRHDWLVEAGGGFDFYFPYFKFGVELKMSYGFNDLLISENNIYTDGITSLNSKLFQISFTFE
jgi:hypothetical protein